MLRFANVSGRLNWLCPKRLYLENISRAKAQRRKALPRF